MRPIPARKFLKRRGIGLRGATTHKTLYAKDIRREMQNVWFHRAKGMVLNGKRYGFGM